MLAHRAVEGGERMHFVGRELFGSRAHLLIDVILANALGEGRELPFEVSSVLPLQCRNPDFKASDFADQFSVGNSCPGTLIDYNGLYSINLRGRS